MSPVLEDLLGLESLNQSAAPTFQELLQRLWEARYQGSVTLNFAGGLPRSVVLSEPVHVPLDTKRGSGA